jgi:two-component system, NarL family, sensor histidine kinase UhpB
MEKSLKVLIIEDNENDAILMLRQLRQSGYVPAHERVDTKDGVIRAISKEWDIIISDYVLPEFSGLETLKILQDSRRDIPCIIVSGKITDEIAVTAMRAGARDYIMKDNLKRLGPVVERELAEAVTRREQRSLQEEKEQFTRRLMEVQEEERKRISRDLHDETAQYLALLSLEMDNLISKEESSSQEVVSKLKRLKEIADKALHEVRRFSHELRPSVLEQFGLAEALKLIIGEFNERQETHVGFKIDGEEARLKEDVELVLFRITQEALNNIRKHSEAKAAEVILKFSSNKVSLSIADYGKGFDVSKKRVSSEKGGLGLVGMRERAGLVGAALKIKSTINKGTTVLVEVAC